MRIDAADVSGVLLSEQKLMRILKSRFKEKISRIETDSEGFRICFDPKEPINAVIMGKEDMSDFLKKYYGRTVVNVSDFHHEEYMVRFEE